LFPTTSWLSGRAAQPEG